MHAGIYHTRVHLPTTKKMCDMSVTELFEQQFDRLFSGEWKITNLPDQLPEDVDVTRGAIVVGKFWCWMQPYLAPNRTEACTAQELWLMMSMYVTMKKMYGELYLS
jgi:hypothetical protein